MTTNLPPQPDLDQLKRQAKDLLKAHQQGNTKACPILRQLHRFSHASDADILKSEVKLNEIQFALALDHGFSSWNSLKEYIDDIAVKDKANMRGESKKRVTGNHLLHWDLVEQTGIESVDDFLYSVINILRIHLGEDLRAVYAIGSYTYGGYAPTSDIDICFVFRDGTDRVRETWSIVQHVCTLADQLAIDPLYYGYESPLYDATQCDERGCTPVLRLALKEHSILLFGEDLRPKIALCSADELLEDILKPPLNWIKQAHNKGSEGCHPLDMPITYPLTNPAPDSEDLGFGDFHSVGVRTMHIARALIALRTGTFLFDKREISSAFTHNVGGPWAKLVSSVSEARYGKVNKAEQREIWLEACRSMTAFENYFIECLTDKAPGLSHDIVGIT